LGIKFRLLTPLRCAVSDWVVQSEHAESIWTMIRQVVAAARLTRYLKYVHRDVGSQDVSGQTDDYPCDSLDSVLKIGLRSIPCDTVT